MNPLDLSAAQDFVAARAPKQYYAETYRGYEALYLPGVVDRTTGLPPGTAIDVGPGWGTMAVLLASRGWAVDVVDFLPVGTFMAQELLDETKITYHQFAVETEEPFLRLGADLVLMTMVVGHLRYRPDIAIKRAARWLAPGGLFVCCNIDADRNPPVPHAYPDWRKMPVPGDGAEIVDDMVTNMMGLDDYWELLGGCFEDVVVEPHPSQAILYGVCRGPKGA